MSESTKRRNAPRCPINNVSANTAYNKGCRCELCTAWASVRHLPRAADHEVPAAARSGSSPQLGELEAAVVADVARFPRVLTDNPRGAVLYATARKLARILDREVATSVAAVTRELRETTNALLGDQSAGEVDAFDAFVDEGGGPVVALTAVRDAETA